MNTYGSKDYMLFMGKAEFEKALHTLMGLLVGINIDRKLNDDEYNELVHWIQVHSYYKNKHPFDEIIPLLTKSLEDHQLDLEEVEDIVWVCTQFLNDNPYFSSLTRDIQILQGILHGIMSDNTITSNEIIGLREWLIDHEHLETIYPYDEIFSIVVSVIQDGVIDKEEEKLLKAIFSEFIDTQVSLNLNKPELDAIKSEMNINGICAVGPNIEFTGNIFCFTGTSSRASRSKIANIIEEKKGIYKDSVINNTSYLIVGDEGNPCWAFSCYGRKIEKAINLRKKGHRIIIAHEVDFWDAL